jgi:hypothetical protein
MREVLREEIGVLYEISADVGGAVDGLFAVNALGWPGHRIQQHQALVGELFLEQRFLRPVQLHGVVIAAGQKGQAV